MVELIEGSGLFIPVEDLSKYDFMAKTPPHLARLLFKHFFAEEVLATHNLYPIVCNANKPAPEDMLPELNPHKRNTILSKNWRLFFDN